MAQVQHIYAVVASGSAVSATAALQGASVAGVHVPVNSPAGDGYFQVSHDTTSANFVRYLPLSDTSSNVFSVSSGPAAFMVPPDVMAFPFVRYEFENAQSDTRTITFVVKL